MHGDAASEGLGTDQVELVPGAIHLVTKHVEDTHFRVTNEGAALSLHARNDQHPAKRWKAKIHAPKI